MTKSKDGNWLGILTGYKYIMEEQSLNQVFIFKKTKEDGKVSFELHKKCILKGNPDFKDVSASFYF